MDRGLLHAASTAQLSLRRSVAVGQSGGPRVSLAAGDGTFGVISGDIAPGRKPQSDMEGRRMQAVVLSYETNETHLSTSKTSS